MDIILEDRSTKLDDSDSNDQQDHESNNSAMNFCLLDGDSDGERDDLGFTQRTHVMTDFSSKLEDGTINHTRRKGATNVYCYYDENGDSVYFDDQGELDMNSNSDVDAISERGSINSAKQRREREEWTVAQKVGCTMVLHFVLSIVGGIFYWCLRCLGKLSCRKHQEDESDSQPADDPEDSANSREGLDSNSLHSQTSQSTGFGAGGKYGAGTGKVMAVPQMATLAAQSAAASAAESATTATAKASTLAGSFSTSVATTSLPTQVGIAVALAALITAAVIGSSVILLRNHQSTSIDETIQANMTSANLPLFCTATSEAKQGALELQIGGFPPAGLPTYKSQMGRLFQEVYNNISGMCLDPYSRILQEATIIEWDILEHNQTTVLKCQWSAQLTCNGCPEYEPLFSMNDIPTQHNNSHVHVLPTLASKSHANVASSEMFGKNLRQLDYSDFFPLFVSTYVYNLALLFQQAGHGAMSVSQDPHGMHTVSATTISHPIPPGTPLQAVQGGNLTPYDEFVESKEGLVLIPFLTNQFLILSQCLEYGDNSTICDGLASVLSEGNVDTQTLLDCTHNPTTPECQELLVEVLDKSQMSLSLTMNNNPNPMNTGAQLDSLIGIHTVECGNNVSNISTQVVSQLLLNMTSLMEEEIELVERTFLETYNNLSFAKCDGYFRKVEDVQLEFLAQGSFPQLSGLQAAGFETIGNSNNTSSNRSVTTSLDEQHGLSLSIFKIHGTCRNCPVSSSGNFKLFDDTYRRSLTMANEIHLTAGPLQSSDRCVCPLGTEPGQGPTIEEFEEAFIKNLAMLMQRGELYSLTETASDVTEVEEVECSTQINAFKSEVSVQLGLASNALSVAEVGILEDLFEETYNYLSFLACDGYFRTAVDASFVPQMGQQRQLLTRALNANTTHLNPNTTNDTSGTHSNDVEEILNSSATNPIDYESTTTDDGSGVFIVRGSCRECPVSEGGNFNLFDDAFQQKVQRNLHSRANTVGFFCSGMHRNLVEESSPCLCPVGSTPGADPFPTEEEFLAEFNRRLEEMKNSGVVLSATEMVVVGEITNQPDNLETTDRGNTPAPTHHENFGPGDTLETPLQPASSGQSFSATTQPTSETTMETTPEFEALSSVSGSDSKPMTDQPTSLPTSFRPLPIVAPAALPTSNQAPTKSPINLLTAPSPMSTSKPSTKPTSKLSESPTMKPTKTKSPLSLLRTSSPVAEPTSTPSYNPTITHSMGHAPTKDTTTLKTNVSPSPKPTLDPTSEPTSLTSGSPTNDPTELPTQQQSKHPTDVPSELPTAIPSLSPTTYPSGSPTEQPTHGPSSYHSAKPTISPTEPPSNGPSFNPSAKPTVGPTAGPTQRPTSRIPTIATPSAPTKRPVDQIASARILPTAAPSQLPTPAPTAEPTPSPTLQPTQQPTRAPTGFPTPLPTRDPTPAPTPGPTNNPTSNPTPLPTNAPTPPPTQVPTPLPTASPTPQPTAATTPQPTSSPTPLPTAPPTESQPTNPSLCVILPSSSVSGYIVTFSGTVSVLFGDLLIEAFESGYLSIPSTCRAEIEEVVGQLFTEGGAGRRRDRRLQATTEVAFTITAKLLAGTSLLSLPMNEESFLAGFNSAMSAALGAPDAVAVRTWSSFPTDSPVVVPSFSPSNAPSANPSSSPSSCPSSHPSHEPSLSPSLAPTEVTSAQPSNNPSTNPSHEPSAAPSTPPSASASPTIMPSVQPSVAPSPSPSSPPSLSPSVQPSHVPSTSPSSLDSQPPSISPSASPTEPPTSIPTASNFPSATPSMSPSAHPSETRSNYPSAAPSTSPSFQPSASPSASPSEEPTRRPSIGSPPSDAPSQMQSRNPGHNPSLIPSRTPSALPSTAPSPTQDTIPSFHPSKPPSFYSSEFPSSKPSNSNKSSSPSQPDHPSPQPSSSPSQNPTSTLSSTPSINPSLSPSWNPSHAPSQTPSAGPRGNPTVSSSTAPSTTPSVNPSKSPSDIPSQVPSRTPSATPSMSPSKPPSNSPSSVPSAQPSSLPTLNPTPVPTSSPTAQPSSLPTVNPTPVPTSSPIPQPTAEPTIAPTTQTTPVPTGQPTPIPTSPPTPVPTATPTAQPTPQPTTPAPSPAPTAAPSPAPSQLPTPIATAQPTPLPTNQPTPLPTPVPTPLPTPLPTAVPTPLPTAVPTPQPTPVPTPQPTTPFPTTAGPSFFTSKAELQAAIAAGDWTSSSYGPVANWDVSRIDNFSFLFLNEIIFNQDLSGWETSQVTRMDGVFQNCAAFAGSGVGNWDTGNVIDFSYAFQGASSFDQDLSGWDVSKSTTLLSMFNGAEAFTGVGLNAWDVSLSSNMVGMFNGATVFNGDINGWIVSSVTDMNLMFYNAAAFNQPLPGWNVSKVTSLQGMFRGATAFTGSLTSGPGIQSWTISSVTTLQETFMGATSFNTDLSSWNIATVTTIQDSFNGATSFNKDLCSWGATTTITTANPWMLNAFASTACSNTGDPDPTASPKGPFCAPC